MKNLIKIISYGFLLLLGQRAHAVELDPVLIEKFNNKLAATSIFPMGREELGAADIAAIAHVLEKNDRLQVLNLTKRNIGPRLAKLLKNALILNKTLSSLKLGANRLGNKSGTAMQPRIEDEGVGYIAEGLRKNKGLTELNLSFNKIHNGGALALADALLENTSLKELNLNNNKITNKGARDLANALKNNSSLISLELSGNEIDDFGAQAFVEALYKNNFLQQLKLDAHNIRDKAILQTINSLLEKNKN